MGRIVLGIVAVLASFMLAESLICNQCSYGLLDFCFSNSEVNCSTNTSNCFTGKATFPSFSSVGFNVQGCREREGCTGTTNGSILGAEYTVEIVCCSEDRCNPFTVGGAPSTKMTLSAAVTAAVLAFMWGSIL